MSKSSITTTNRGRLPNPHPGEILLEEFLKPMGLSQNALARAIHVPPRRINELVLGKRSVSADTDLRLARYFGMSEGFFLGLQKLRGFTHSLPRNRYLLRVRGCASNTYACLCSSKPEKVKS